MGLDEVMRWDPCDGTSGCGAGGETRAISVSPPSETQRDGHLPAGREPFSGNQLGQDFDLGLSNPSTLRNKFLLLKLSLQYFCMGV